MNRIVLISTSVALLVIVTPAPAQIAGNIPISQADLTKESPDKQGVILSKIVRDAHGVGSKPCDSGKATLKKSFKEGSGGWLLQCTGGTDNFVVMPADAGKAATVISCPMMKSMMGRDCYTIQ